MARGTIIIRTRIFLLLMLGVGPAFAQSGQEPTHIQVARAVFRLETAEIVERQGNIAKMLFRPAGTGFVVGSADRAYLVTARHVADLPHDLRARVPTKRKDTGKTEVLELRIPRNAWVTHPVGPDPTIAVRGVDVAVALLPIPTDQAILEFTHCTACPPGRSSQVALVDPRPPQTILVVGFPKDLGFTLREQRPMFRSGIVALVAGERFLKIEGSFADERTFVIDSKIEKGNSGSPILRVDQTAKEYSVVGLVSAAELGSDFGVAEPASRILEAIEKAKANPSSVLPEWYRLPPDQANQN